MQSGSKVLMGNPDCYFLSEIKLIKTDIRLLFCLQRPQRYSKSGC
jgi:hypothetical protein